MSERKPIDRLSQDLFFPSPSLFSSSLSFFLLCLLCVFSFLGMTDIYGSMYESDVLATGFGLHLALPLLRKHARLDMTEAEAKKLLEDAMKVCFYRDCKALNSVHNTCTHTQRVQ